MIRLVACLAVSAASALTPPKLNSLARRGPGASHKLIDAAIEVVPRGGAGSLAKFTSLWRETDGIILVYFWAAPYVGRRSELRLRATRPRRRRALVLRGVLLVEVSSRLRASSPVTTTAWTHAASIYTLAKQASKKKLCSTLDRR